MNKRIHLLLSFLLIVCLLLSGCAKKDTTGNYRLSKQGEVILNDASLQSDFTCGDNSRVMYEIFVGSFSDSNGDGIGDLQGIIQRMDYLNDGDPNSGESLGIEGIWLSPIFDSPSYHKYDVSDYYTIDPDFGTMDDLAELLEICHERNVIVIIDLPINHTGALNSWYSQFRMAHMKEDTANEYYNFYSWVKAGEQEGGKSYKQINGTDHYVECNFSGDMPEPDFDNPQVRSTFLDVARYYLDLGVDGFRFDAAKYVYFGDTAANVEFWCWYIDELKTMKPDIYTVAEVWDSDSVTDDYYAALNCFDFTTSQVNGLISETAQKGDVNRFTAYTEKYLDTIHALRSDAMQLYFITNHDMDRAAGFLTELTGYSRMAANLYLLSPGSPFIYYGEEIGMKGSRGGATTDANRRLAMLWGDDDTIKNPSGSSYAADSQTNGTVADQIGNGDSLYNYYKRLIMIRNANPEIARGTYDALEFTGTKLGGFTSTYEGSTVAVLHNTSGSAITVDLSTVTDLSFTEIRAVAGYGTAVLDGTTLTLDSQTSVVIK